MTPDFDPQLLRAASQTMLAELLQAEASLKLMHGSDNRLAMKRLIAVKRAALEFHNWNLKEMGL